MSLKAIRKWSLANLGASISYSCCTSPSVFRVSRESRGESDLGMRLSPCLASVQDFHPAAAIHEWDGGALSWCKERKSVRSQCILCQHHSHLASCHLAPSIGVQGHYFGQCFGFSFRPFAKVLSVRFPSKRNIFCLDKIDL